MCGIIGYIGTQSAAPLLLEGLRRQSYRGYDSSGIVVFEKENPKLLRAVGKLEELEAKVREVDFVGTIGLGHSRWGSHGAITEANAHPHADCNNNIFVVHNGIIENFISLRSQLEKRGHRFRSETDTEVLSHLIEHFFKGDLAQATRKALQLVKGSYGIAVIASQDPGKIVAARVSSPLVVAVNDTGGFVASDPSALVSHSKQMVFLDDGEVVILQPGSFSVTDLQNIPRVKEVTELDWDVEEAQKGGYSHFMQKEIMEQPESIENVIRGRLLVKEGTAKLGGLERVEEKLRNIQRLHIIACGTAFLAAMTGKYMIEEYAGIPCEVDIASEFRYRKPIVSPDTAFLFISQSGETADTLAALREVKRKGGLTLGIVNVVGSSVAREITAGIYNHAGPEIGVASTKAFTSQLVALALLTLFLARQRTMSLVMGKRIAESIAVLPRLVEQVLEQGDVIREIAKKYAESDNMLYIGRKYNYPIALEGALKLKEISYVHAEGYGAGEMKHGPIALIDERFPTVAICPTDSVYEKMVSNIQEIKARNGPVIALATEGNEEIAELADEVIYIPKTLEMLTPILSVLPLQMFAYEVGVQKGYDVDKPRNLAKSVTVE